MFTVRGAAFAAAMSFTALGGTARNTTSNLSLIFRAWRKIVPRVHNAKANVNCRGFFFVAVP